MFDKWMPELLMAFVTSLVVTGLLRKWFLKIKVQQLVMRSNGKGPDHQAKAGTPTMGGAGFIAVVTVAFLVRQFFFGGMNPTSWAIIVAILLYAFVGGFDDSVKIFEHRDEGFRFWPKLIVQIIAALIAFSLLFMGDFEYILHFGFFNLENIFVFGTFTVIWLVGWSNAVNLSDGLDGLATGLTVIAYSAYLIIALQYGNYDVAALDALVVGALLGFFFWNQNPAKIFMGDTGSLALGAGLAMNSLTLGIEWSLVVIGLVFALEALSVMIQVGSYHWRGKRIFLMTPIHHAFEKGGWRMNPKYPWNEWQIDGLFWMVGLLAVLLYLFIWL
ncbi:mraY protein [Weissella kandleri]|uniref:Phospho-N-acetylmuramoyl-pentapeptide-transferase n=1 Tax=Weissella kandleri TaxID=1616 RepID=A0A0R2JNV4_9LACO|nr:phospho-N-acetylmuramoyl-pentapeptide-transferase [Weissella kandleri]KRN75709.1 mraY protein [Weissella kandleri]